MKKFLLLISFVFLFADNVTSLLNKIPKNSSDYTLATAIVQKINTLKPKKIVFNPTTIDELDYEKKFFGLMELKNELLILPKKMDDLQKKINYLQNSDKPVSKLQMLFYQKKLNLLQNRLNFLQDNIKAYEKELFKKSDKIKFDVNYAAKQINYWNKLLKQKKKEYEKLNIDLQKWQILNNKSNIDLVKNYIKINLSRQKQIYKNLINNSLIIWFNELKNKNKNIFNLTKKIINYENFIEDSKATALNKVMFDFEKFKFGKSMLLYQSKDEFKIFLSKLDYFLNYPLFKVGNRTITPVNFFLFVLILIIGWFIGKYYKRLIYKIRKKYNLSQATATLLANMGYYAILTLSFLMALKAVGLDLSSLAMIAGALSVGIGFGLQNIVSNFVSGIIMMFERTIKVGDYIQIDENTRGEVIDISMRSTIIRTNDNINLIIPNQAFIQNNVINWTLGDDIVRFRVPFGVAYGSDIDKVEVVVLNALKNSNLPYVKKDKKYDVTPRVVFLEMGDSSLNFELFIWVGGEYAKRPRGTKSEFLKIIYNALNKAGIEIPFPQQDLHIRDSIPFEINIKKD